MQAAVGVGFCVCDVDCSQFSLHRNGSRSACVYVCVCEFSRRSLFGQFKETRSLARRRRRKMFVALSLNKPGQLTLFTLLRTLFLLLPKQRRSAKSTADPVPSSKSNNNKPNFPPSLSCGIYGERGAADRAVGQVDGNDNKSHANTKTIQLLQLSPS